MKQFIVIITFFLLAFGNSHASNLPDTTLHTKSCSVTLQNDSTIITSDEVITVTLTAPSGAWSYLWTASNPSAVITDPTSNITTATITDTTTFYLEATYIGQTNLVVNGDFEAGNTGFTTQLTYNNNSYNGLWNEGTYTVDYNAYTHHYLLSNCTHNGGKYFMANGTQSPNMTVWQQTITTQPGTLYLFYADMTNLAINTPLNELSILRFSVNGNLIGSQFTVTQPPCDWQTFASQFTATSTSSVIRVVNQNLQQPGNDFGLDNICVKEVCVAIDSVTFNVCQPCFDTTLYAVICQGEAYTENGFNETASGTYYDTIPLPCCDSVVTLHLLVNPTYDTTIYDTICEGNTYTDNGFNRSITGTDTLFLQTANGCDSIVILNLAVMPVYSLHIYDTICKGEVYSANGFNQTTSGTYNQNLQTSFGCDSIITLHLVVNDTFH
ncbi:MAG: hypothetical protein LBR17_08025, partial [Bacteroidales bacterium]|nr:hypothetical protein [Bacteroidales bacterium]